MQSIPSLQKLQEQSSFANFTILDPPGNPRAAISSHRASSPSYTPPHTPSQPHSPPLLPFPFPLTAPIPLLAFCCRKIPLRLSRKTCTDRYSLSPISAHPHGLISATSHPELPFSAPPIPTNRPVPTTLSTVTFRPVATTQNTSRPCRALIRDKCDPLLPRLLTPLPINDESSILDQKQCKSTHIQTL